MKMDREKLLSACAACALTFAGLAIAAPVLGQIQPVVVTAPSDYEERLTTRVSYRDLDLASAKGERTLVRRVHRAIGDVCPFEQSNETFVRLQCRTYAWNGAKQQIDRAVMRAKDIASTGTSSIAPVAIAIVAPGY